MAITTCIFDAYGTLFDVAAAARQAASEPEFAHLAGKWPQIAGDWREKQLSYSWLRAVQGAHVDFWRLTQDGLDWALEAAGLLDDAALRNRLLALYWELSAYPEVNETLEALRDDGRACAILSNGAPEMLAAAVRSAGIQRMLEACLSVESVGHFKPHAAVYQMVMDRFKCAPDEVLFVSSNGWDAAAAQAFGYTAAWVNRAGAPLDRLNATPDHILSDLRDIPRLARQL